MTRLTIALCASRRFYPEAERLAGELTAAGVPIHTPRFDVLAATSPEHKAELTHLFLTKLHRSACLYIVAVGGYTGCSVAIETGYAAALGLPVYACERPAEDAMAALVKRVVPLGDAAAFLSGQGVGP